MDRVVEEADNALLPDGMQMPCYLICMKMTLPAARRAMPDVTVARIAAGETRRPAGTADLCIPQA